MKEFIDVDRLKNIIGIMNEEYNFDFNIVKENIFRFGADMLIHIKDKVTDLVSMNYMMKNLEIDKLYALLIVRLFEYNYIEIIKIQNYFKMDFTDTNNHLNNDITRILDSYFNICFNQAVMNNKLNTFVEIYFFLNDISSEFYSKMKVDQNNAFIKFENGILF
jgi:hypothetical protein